MNSLKRKKLSRKYSLKRKTADRLKSELRGNKIVTATFAVILTVLFIVNIYGLLSTAKNEVFIVGLVVAICLSIIFPLQFRSMRKIKAELKDRQNTN